MASGTTPARGKLLDYEQFIDHQLGLTQSQIKKTDVLTAGAILVASFVGVLFLEILLDHLFGLPLIVRQLVLFSGLIAGTIYAVRKIFQPLLSRVNGLYAAKTIESVDPAFKNSLISYLDLRGHRGEVAKSILVAVENKAVKDLSTVEMETVVNQQRLVRMVYILCGLIVAFCIYAWSTPKSIPDSIKRALLADVNRPTNTRLVNVKPGDDPEKSTVVAGSIVEYAAEVQGARPDRVVLNYSTDGGRFFAKKELVKGEKDYLPWKVELRGKDVQQSMEYYLTAGDATTKTYQLTVLPAPMVTAVQHDLAFPPYTKFPPRGNIPGGNIEALEGTIVTVRAQTNQPAESGTIDLGAGGAFSMEVKEDDPKSLIGRFRVTDSGTYTVKFKTTGGQVNPEPVVYDIKAHKDEEPTVEFLRPGRPITVPSNAKVALVMEAKDDFGLKDVTLHVRQENDILQPAQNFLEKQAPVRVFRHTEVLDVASLRVAPGSKVEYWLTVRDTKEPQSNRAETPKQELIIGAPIDQKKADEMAKTDDVPPPDANPDDPEANEPADESPPEPDPADQLARNDEPDPKATPPDEPREADPKSGPAETDQDKNNGNRELTPEELKKLDALERAANKLQGNRPKAENPPPQKAGNPPQPKPQDAKPQPSKDGSPPPKEGNGQAQQQSGTPKQSGGTSSPNSQPQNPQNSGTSPTGNPNDAVSHPQDSGTSKPQPGSKNDSTPQKNPNSTGTGNPNPNPNNVSRPGENSPKPGTPQNAKPSTDNHSSTPKGGHEKSGTTNPDGSQKPTPNGTDAHPKPTENPQNPGETTGKKEQNGKTGSDQQQGGKKEGTPGTSDPSKAADKKEQSGNAGSDQQQGGKKEANQEKNGKQQEGGQGASDPSKAANPNSGDKKDANSTPAGSPPGATDPKTGQKPTPGSTDSKAGSNAPGAEKTPNNGEKPGTPKAGESAANGNNPEKTQGGTSPKPGEDPRNAHKSPSEMDNESKKDAANPGNGPKPEPGKPSADSSSNPKTQTGNDPKSRPGDAKDQAGSSPNAKPNDDSTKAGADQPKNGDPQAGKPDAGSKPDGSTEPDKNAPGAGHNEKSAAKPTDRGDAGNPSTKPDNSKTGANGEQNPGSPKPGKPEADNSKTGANGEQHAGSPKPGKPEAGHEPGDTKAGANGENPSGTPKTGDPKNAPGTKPQPGKPDGSNPAATGEKKPGNAAEDGEKNPADAASKKPDGTAGQPAEGGTPTQK